MFPLSMFKPLFVGWALLDLVVEVGGKEVRAMAQFQQCMLCGRGSVEEDLETFVCGTDEWA